MALNPPPIPGLGASGGFSLYIMNKSGASDEEFQRVVGEFLGAANQRPEIQMAYTTFRSDTPSYNYDIDREKAQRNGVAVGDIFTALQAYYGSVQINDFTIYGRNFKVVAQADTQYRTNPGDNKFLTVRDNKGNMVPISTFITPKKSNAISVITRYDNFPAVKVGGQQKDGYSSGRRSMRSKKPPIRYFRMVMASNSSNPLPRNVKRAVRQYMPSRSACSSYSCLWQLSMKAGRFHSRSSSGYRLVSLARAWAAMAFHVYNDIYFQIGLLTIIGLAAKNAILIVEYAKVRVDNGMDVMKASIEASQIRLRPILMTSLAFILGNIPLALSTGAGSNSRSEMGIAVVFGVLSATVFQIFIVPMLFVVIERIHGFKRPKKEFQ